MTCPRSELIRWVLPATVACVLRQGWGEAEGKGECLQAALLPLVVWGKQPGPVFVLTVA